MTSLIIKTKALNNNIAIIKRLAGDAQIIAVLKGNAYGLGLVPFASYLNIRGIQAFGVTELSDAILLRESGITGTILLMAPIYDSERIAKAIEHRITLSITSTDCAEMIEETAAYLKCPPVEAHLCIDTGFGRYGFLCSEQAQIIETVNRLRHVRITGIFSHFHAASCKNDSYARSQFHTFTTLCTALQDAGVHIGLRHISSSTSLLRFPYMNLDAVRIGSAFLGRFAVPDAYGFQPVCQLSASVDDVYELPAGHNIGYGHSFHLAHPTKTAVVSAGYYHGLGMERHTDPRSGVFFPLRIYKRILAQHRKEPVAAYFQNTSLPILGQISMNSVIVNAGHSRLSIGDTVTFPINPIFVNSAVPRMYV